MKIRLPFLILAFSLFSMLASLPHAHAELLPLYIGNYTQNKTQGINLAYFNTKTGKLKNMSIAAPTASPTFLALHPNEKYLYAVNENGSVSGQNIGGISAFEIEKGNRLKPLNAVAAGGGLCHLCIDATGKYLLATAYSGGSTEVWSLKPNGEIGERLQFILNPPETGDNGQRKVSHGHQIVLSPDNRFAFAVDLGLDKVFIFRFNARTGMLTPATIPYVRLDSGAGPRHLAFSPDTKFAYVINELGNTLTAFKYHEGKLENLQTVSTLPENFLGENYTAEVEVHPNGRFLYGSNRRRDSIVIHSIEPADGRIKQIGEVFTEGRNPRHFALSPDGRWLLAANQNDSSIIIFKLDPKTGMLTKSSIVKDVPGEPVCLLFAPGKTPAAN